MITTDTTDTEYYVMIHTGPEGWRHPYGWTRTDRADAQEMLASAERTWDAARLHAPDGTVIG